MADNRYSRPAAGFRYKAGGMKTNTVADNCPTDKYPFAQNIRWPKQGTARSRWGLSLLASTSVLSTSPITDMRAYSRLQADNFPRVVVRRADDQVWEVTSLGAATNLGTLAGAGSSSGATLIPFRPNQSPNPYMYIANGSDYQKFPATLTAPQKVGIAEPQAPPDAGFFSQFQNLYNVGAGAAGWTPDGVHITAVSNGARVTDTIGASFPDPASPLAASSLFVSPSQIYSRFMILLVGGVTLCTVQDVLPNETTLIGVAGIYYYSGIVGRCVVTTQAFSQGFASGAGQADQSLYTQALLASLRRGAIVTLGVSLGNSEQCLVLSTAVGPNGQISFETVTVNPHAAGENMLVNDAIYVNSPVAAGLSIASPSVFFNCSAGIGTITQTVSNFFSAQNTIFQPDDYLHFSVKIDNLANLSEMKILFDVGDGSFTQNFYYYTVRPSDITAAVQNTLTQLGAAQLVSQRAIIDQEIASSARNQGRTESSAQTSPGSNQWSEITFPISAMTRVGNDQSKSLLNANAIQFMFNASGPLVLAINSISVFGGYQIDCGPTGAPYQYRIRPRSSITGAKGNPSPATRYAVTARRQEVVVTVPATYADPQVDTWDIFRYGGTVTSWRKVGQVPIGTTQFLDIYSDDAALSGEPLELDNLEPWPTIDVPLNTTASVIGTTALVTVPAPTNILRMLPGNEVLLGNGNAYTLWTRPTQTSTPNQYLLQFLENAGTYASTMLSIYEPEIANQKLPYMWGPDAEGTVFAVGDPLRPGTVYYAKNNNPDSAPDRYNTEVTPPTEPMMGGAIIEGLSYAASTERWWALYPQPQNPLQRYSFVQQPLARGLAAPRGLCTDGKNLYWWAKDGIWASHKGSLTDEDLYNIFPHDGVAGANYTYGNHTAYAPDYSRAATFRLAYRNSYLYANYQDSTGTQRSLTLDTRTGAWVADVHANSEVTCTYAVEQQEGSLVTNGVPYPTLVFGALNGSVYQEQDGVNDGFSAAPFAAGSPIACLISTTEWDGGDIRASEQWGDAMVDLTPAATAGVTISPVVQGAIPAALASTVVPTSTSRQQAIVSLGGGFLTNYLGYLASWSDDFSVQSAPTQLHVWQPSYIDKPETIEDRFTDWNDAGVLGSKFFQGFLLRADTFNAAKGMTVRSANDLLLHPFTPTVIHDGESTKAYSFATPFTAYEVRLEPTDEVPWRYFDIKWIAEPTPDEGEVWQTQATAFGLTGYAHLKMINAAYSATAPVTLAITAYDGTSPAAITLPSTGGAYQKTLFMLSPNKGLLYSFRGVSAQPWQAFVKDWDLYVGQWGRGGGYLIYKSLGGLHGDQARI